MRDAAESQHRFRRIATAGIFFQGGAAAVDTGTIMATLTYGLTGSTAVFLNDQHFRLFIYAQHCCSSTEPRCRSISFRQQPARAQHQKIALLLGAQTVGALLSNPLWDWWVIFGANKACLEMVVASSAVAPVLTLIWIFVEGNAILPWFTAVFLLLGAASYGVTIAQLGYLMEISPDRHRPAYSGYFNAWTAPAALLPIVGAALAETLSYAAVFATSGAAAALQLAAVYRLRGAELRGDAR